MVKDRLLVIEPHSDDSAIGAGAYLEHQSSIYDLYFLLVSASSLELKHKYVSRETRLDEYQKYVNSLGGQYLKANSRNPNINLPIDKETYLDTVPMGDLVSAIENTINKIKPSELLIMGPSFYKDHTIVYEAVEASTRPTFEFTVNKVLLMENPTYVHSWEKNLKPNYYFCINEDQLKRKLDRFEKYFPSQIRGGSNYLSREIIKQWSRYRGLEARSNYAEAFTLLFQKI